MKCLLLPVVLLLAWAPVAPAGPNAGGVIVVHDADYYFTTYDYDYCGDGTIPASCMDIDARLDGGSSTPKIFKVYAAFPAGSSPRLKGMCFGVHYAADEVVITAYGHCIGDVNNGAIEISGVGWPGPDTGTSMVFQYTQTSHLVECYWFAGYNYYYPQPAIFALRDHPDPVLGGVFADDSIPSILDPIAAYGSLGFDTEGTAPCPDLGACCFCDGSCGQTPAEECPTGYWLPGVSCEPNPCAWPLGACCLPDLTCIMQTECLCQEMGGEWIPDVPCSDELCAHLPPGACCNLETGECHVMSESECGAQEYPHEYMGNGTDCEPNPCPEPVPVRESTWGQIKNRYR